MPVNLAIGDTVLLKGKITAVDSKGVSVYIKNAKTLTTPARFFARRWCWIGTGIGGHLTRASHHHCRLARRFRCSSILHVLQKRFMLPFCILLPVF